MKEMESVYVVVPQNKVETDLGTGEGKKKKN